MTREEALQYGHLMLSLEEDKESAMYDFIATVIQALEQTRWIPVVSEGLPKSAGVYIVTREFTDGFVCADLTDACYFDGTSTWHNDNRINHGREYVDKKIKAWMPLPEPYVPDTNVGKMGESEITDADSD